MCVVPGNPENIAVSRPNFWWLASGPFFVSRVPPTMLSSQQVNLTEGILGSKQAVRK